MATINGKTLQQCLHELSTYQKPDKYLQDKYPYYKIRTYFEKINSVLGMEHYNVTYPLATEVYKIRNEQEFLNVKCHLEIIDDDGNVILIREGFAGREITFNKNGKEVNLNNIYRSVSQLAFKAAWDHLNIFGKAYAEDPEDYSDCRGKEEHAQYKEAAISSETSQTNTTGNHGTTVNSTPVYRVNTAGKFLVDRKDSYGKPVYTVLGYCQDNKKCKVVFYPNQYKNYADRLNSYINLCNEGRAELQFKASSSGTKDGALQLIFKGFI